MTEFASIVGCASVRLVEWREGATGAGVDPRSAYAERYWLPVLGPSTLLLLRHFAWQLDAEPSGADLVLRDLACNLGLGDRAGRHAPFFRTIERAAEFAMIRFEPMGVIAARRRLPFLSARQLSRLPNSSRCLEALERQNAISA